MRCPVLVVLHDALLPGAVYAAWKGRTAFPPVLRWQKLFHALV